jgi:hypothetical protein
MLHVLLDLSGCDPDLLEDGAHVRQIARLASPACCDHRAGCKHAPICLWPRSLVCRRSPSCHSLSMRSCF